MKVLAPSGSGCGLGEWCLGRLRELQGEAPRGFDSGPRTGAITGFPQPRLHCRPLMCRLAAGGGDRPLRDAVRARLVSAHGRRKETKDSLPSHCRYSGYSASRDVLPVLLRGLWAGETEPGGRALPGLKP